MIQVGTVARSLCAVGLGAIFVAVLSPSSGGAKVLSKEDSLSLRGGGCVKCQDSNWCASKYPCTGITTQGICQSATTREHVNIGGRKHWACPTGDMTICVLSNYRNCKYLYKCHWTGTSCERNTDWDTVEAEKTLCTDA